MTNHTITGYLKWADTIVEEIMSHREVRFVPHETDAKAQQVIAAITNNATHWDEFEYTIFLEYRIVSQGRRVIERILV